MQTASQRDLDLLRIAVKDKSLVFLEGFHSVKHAVRFGAEILLVVTTDPAHMHDLSSALAPDVLERLQNGARVVRKRDTKSLSMIRSHWTDVWGVARRPATDEQQVLASTNTSPLVLLEHPKNLGNIGACIRVAAAAGAGGVLVTGDADPWEPAAIRGGAGLQYAIPVASISNVEHIERTIIAIDPDGDELKLGSIPPRAVLAFGTEREGLSDVLSSRAQKRIRIPMQPGVSSLNLAVSVGIVLYVWKLAAAEST